MNKIKTLLLALPLIGLAACSTQEVENTIEVGFDITGYWKVPGSNTRYVTPDNNVVFNSCDAVSGNGKTVVATNFVFTLHGVEILPPVSAPYLASIPASFFFVGEDNVVAVQMDLLVEGSSVQHTAMRYTFACVGSVDDLPSGAEFVGDQSDIGDPDDIQPAPAQ